MLMLAPQNFLLIGESFSPWTKKARWALEFCDLAYTYQEFTPTLSEPGLRWRLRQWSGPVSVPVLFAEDQILRGSWDIAMYANNATHDTRLGNFDEIDAWNTVSESGMAEGRTHIVRGILEDKTALAEALPAFVPQFLRRPLRFVARDAVQRLDRKYAHLKQEGALRQALLDTRAGLARSGCDYLLGQFTYADIAMATVLEVVAPRARADPPLGPATQRYWNNAALANEFKDLVAWRNRLAQNPATSFSQFKSDRVS